MLKNISSVISPDLLWLLASMGHGDDLVLVDRNFPAIQVAKQTSTGRLIELPGLNIPQATRAILSLMPLDHFEDSVCIVTGINDNRFARIWVTDNVAITLQHADREDFVNEFLRFRHTPQYNIARPTTSSQPSLAQKIILL